MHKDDQENRTATASQQQQCLFHFKIHTREKTQQNRIRPRTRKIKGFLHPLLFEKPNLSVCSCSSALLLRGWLQAMQEINACQRQFDLYLWVCVPTVVPSSDNRNKHTSTQHKVNTTLCIALPFYVLLHFLFLLSSLQLNHLR